MICPSCKKSQPMTFRCRSCGAELMGARYRDGARTPSAASGPELRAPAQATARAESGLHNPYAAPQAAAQAAAYAEPDESHVLASRGSRLAASLLDGVAAFLAAIPLFIGIAMSDTSMSGASTGLTIVGLLVFGAFAIYQIRLLIGEGQTIGKKAMNIRIVDYYDGTVPPVSQVFVRRYMLNGVLGNIPLYSVVDILLIFGTERRCIHDYLAGTKVVDA